MTGNSTARRADDIGGQELSYAEVKAIASGNPAVLTLAEADAEIQRLSLLRKNHADEQFTIRRKLKELPETTVSFALNAYLFEDNTALSFDEIVLLQQFLRQYPRPYRSQREFCDYRGPGYSIVSSPTGEHLISVYGGYFHRQTRSIARMITKALNGLPSHSPIVPLSDDNADDACPLCGGQRWTLGQLGQLTHHRCRNCGLASHDQTLTV